MQYVDQAVDSLGLARLNTLKPLQKASAATGLKAEYLSLGAAALLSLFLVLTTCGQYTLMYIIVYVYPVWKTFKARENNLETERDRWLVYWTVFGFVVSLISVVSLFVTVPSMPLLLSVFFFAVYAALVDGQAYIYDSVMRPLLKKYEGTIDKYIQMAKDEASDVIKRAKREAANKLIQ